MSEALVEENNLTNSKVVKKNERSNLRLLGFGPAVFAVFYFQNPSAKKSIFEKMYKLRRFVVKTHASDLE
jgi:hypothetical protein